jgi:hypothetical protein
MQSSPALVAPDPTQSAAETDSPAESEVEDPETGIAGAPDEAQEAREAPALGASEISAVVGSYVSGYRKGLIQDWLADCVRYETEHGVQDCPQGQPDSSDSRPGNEGIIASFQRLDGKYRNDRTSRELLASMDRMRPLLNDDSILGELARQRYSYDSLAYTRLNGDDRVPRGGEGGIAIAQLSPGGISFFKRLVKVDFLKGKITFIDDYVSPPQDVFEVYRFTPAARAEPEAAAMEEMAGSFDMVPSLFPSARQ